MMSETWEVECRTKKQQHYFGDPFHLLTSKIFEPNVRIFPAIVPKYPFLGKLLELMRLLSQFICFRLRCHRRIVVVDEVAFTPARIQIID
jgi:hypothetical protein